MIKLNNKNITYVALADSNNSIKAPKEIWYADSNNSVKLVYRRKDALIEGEDYEKYHWLQGRNGAYIDTRYVPIPSEDSFKFKINNNGFWKNPNNNDPHVFGVYSPRIRFGTFASVENRYFFQYSNVVEGVAPYFSSSDYIQEITLLNDGMKTKCIANGIENEYETTITEQFNYSIWLYAINDNPSKYFHGDIAYFRITDSTFVTDKLHLIPCKLLKPVPKWLDANGIRRQVGECGMIDLVSGKFYGNVNSVGTFTVENYYERKEWLVGDGSAYIDTNIIVDVTTLRYSLKFVHDANNIAFMCGSRHSNTHEGDSTALAFDDIHNDKIRLDAISSLGLLYSNIMLNEPNEVLIDCQTNSAIVNNSSITGNRTKFNNSPYTFRIFDAYPKNTTANTCTCKLSYFTLNDSTHSINFIPCTLTMDLPASMDANGIARTKGTSGMWDLVSDRFYGNVANSGTFKAVNLAEGVDYEVHQWLVGDGSAYIEGLTYNMWSNHLETEIGKRANKNLHFYDSASESQLQIGYDNSVLTPYLLVIFRNKGNRNHIADINPFTDMPNVVNFDFYIENSIFYCNRNGTIYTNQDTTDLAIESNWTSIQPKIYAAKMAYIREVLPNDTYRSNLIPVKLLKSIPSKYDANGIARQAGECGMYDTVNDKFYGNVASSGSFTVEDDD